VSAELSPWAERGTGGAPWRALRPKLYTLSAHTVDRAGLQELFPSRRYQGYGDSRPHFAMPPVIAQSLPATSMVMPRAAVTR